MKGSNWNHLDLGVVDTIYEDESEFSSASSPSLSPTFASPPTPLHSKIQAWSLATRREPDILIRVQGTSFHLHKDRLTSRSSYLKRHLTKLSEFTLSPPLNITADTFAVVAHFCYSGNVRITPSNVGALRTASELLGMRETAGGNDENLCQLTETYFSGVVSINHDYASRVLRSCMPLLPEVETMASLVSRCVDALISADDGNNDEFPCLDDIVALHPEDFQTVVDSMNKRFGKHDVLYNIIDIYLTENNFGKLSEEQKIQICNSIDCKKLSPETLIECVQNPTMPLRFIVRAMLVEQLNTRHSIVSAATNAQIHGRRQQRHGFKESTSITLADHLQRDAVIRHNAQLKEAMASTSSRIKSLEKELRVMKKLLLDRQAEEQRDSIVLDSGRSKSFHFVPDDNGKIERGERGSISSASFRFDVEAEKNIAVVRSSSSYGGSYNVENFRMNRTFRQKLMSGLKNAFRVSNSASK